MTWGLAEFAKLFRRSDTRSPAPDHSASAPGMSGPAAITGPMSSGSGAMHLVERRALRMMGNRSPEAVRAFLRTHKALLTCEGTDAR